MTFYGQISSETSKNRKEEFRQHIQNSSFSTTFFIFLIIHITYCNTAFYTDYVVDSTTKVGNFEQITTILQALVVVYLLLILPQR